MSKSTNDRLNEVIEENAKLKAQCDRYRRQALFIRDVLGLAMRAWDQVLDDEKTKNAHSGN